jgi:hypothetical protein
MTFQLPFLRMTPAQIITTPRYSVSGKWLRTIDDAQVAQSEDDETTAMIIHFRGVANCFGSSEESNASTMCFFSSLSCASSLGVERARTDEFGVPLAVSGSSNEPGATPSFDKGTDMVKDKEQNGVRLEECPCSGYVGRPGAPVSGYSNLRQRNSQVHRGEQHVSTGQARERHDTGKRSTGIMSEDRHRHGSHPPRCRQRQLFYADKI